MRRKSLVFAVVFAVMAVIGTAWAAEVIVDEDTLVVFAGQAGNHFHKARESFLRGYVAEAADEVRVGSAFIKLEMARASEDGKKMLRTSTDELDKLANDVEMNVVADAIVLDEAFARANHALASHRQIKAKEYYDKGENERAAVEIKAAAGNLERGFGWAGQKMGEGTVAAIRGTRLLTGKVIQAPGWVISKTGRALAAIGRGTGKAIGAVGKGTGAAIGAVGDVATGVGKGTGEVVKGVGSGTGKVVEGVTGGAGGAIEVIGEETKTGVVVGEAGKAVTAVGAGTGAVVKGVGEGAGTVVEAVGAGTGAVVKGVGKGTGEAVEAVGKGVGWVPEQVGNSIDSIGKAIQKLGKAVEPKKK